MNGIPNFDQICYHYICRNTNLFPIVEESFFKNIYLANTYLLTKRWYFHFKELPFNVSSPSAEQLIEYAERNILDVVSKLDRDKSLDDNKTLFYTTVRNVIEFSYTKYNEDWIKENVEPWIEWEKFQKAQQQSILYQKSVKVTPATVKEIIRKAKDFVVDGSSVLIDSDDGVSFTDASAHRQIDPSNLFNTGWPIMNKWLGGGFEPGTLSIFLGAPNVGKSLFLSNIALNMYKFGYNVLLVSLEMGTPKILKRMGSNAFNIPISEYNSKSQDEMYVGNKIKDFVDGYNNDMTPLGELIVKRFASATMDDVIAYKRKKESELKIKFHACVVDYLGEMANANGTMSNEMYQYHKQNANDMFRSSVKDDWAVITAHQLKQQAYGLSDYGMDALAESSGLNHRADNIFGIIQDDMMHSNGEYQLKNLKARDSEYKNYKMKLRADWTYARLIDTNLEMLPMASAFGGSR